MRCEKTYRKARVRGEARGSSDFKPAADQAFLVTNTDRNGGRMRDLISLDCRKSRYGLSGRIKYQYASGKMLRVQQDQLKKKAGNGLRELLQAHSGILAGAFAALACKEGFTREQARQFLKEGANAGTIRVQKKGRQHHHYWVGEDQNLLEITQTT